MYRILAVDFGEKRCGIAVTDPLQIAAHPLKVEPTKSIEEFLNAYLIAEDCKKIIFGRPTHADGSDTHIWPKIKRLSDSLKSNFPNLAIDFQDESFSSVEARQIMIQSGMKKKNRMKKENTDLISAVIILQRYLKHI